MRFTGLWTKTDLNMALVQLGNDPFKFVNFKVYDMEHKALGARLFQSSSKTQERGFHSGPFISLILIQA